MPRVLRLTLLTPDVVKAILDGRRGAEVTLPRVLGHNVYRCDWIHAGVHAYLP